MTDFTSFAAHAPLVETLLAHADGTPDADGAHDLSHILRVWQNVTTIMQAEGGDGQTLAAATALHDCVNLPKDAPDRATASRQSAARARNILSELNWSHNTTDAVCHAIEAHSFSADIPPRTPEARILQDADRLDALGHIGVARCFFVSGSLGRPLYDPADPAAAHRALDDRLYALDHFPAKLLRLSAGFQTDAGRRMAQARHAILQSFYDGLLAEIAPQGQGG